MTEYKIRYDSPQHEQDRVIVWQILKQLQEQRVPPSALRLLCKIVGDAEDEIHSENAN